MIPLSRPSIGRAERSAVTAVLESGRLAMGPQILAFEAGMAARTETRHAIAVHSGTAALHTVLHALGACAGDEVITTPFSFVASANVIRYTGARPVFVDVDEITGNIDPEAAARAVTERTVGILPVDVFGVPARHDLLSDVAAAHGLWVLDDSCEALGARYDDRAIGSWGRAAAFGFYPNKQITTGEGGCITTDDDELASLCRSLRNHGRREDAVMIHDRLGFNYRMDELSAALGVVQLERFESLQAGRRLVESWYRARLGHLQPDIELPVGEVPEAVISRFVFVVRLARHFGAAERDLVRDRLLAEGVQTAHYFPCIHLQPAYAGLPGCDFGAFPVAESLADRSIALPFWAEMTEEQVDFVAAAVGRSIKTLRASHV